MQGHFRDRRDAGRQLAAQLADYRRVPRLLVLGLPRGGVPVAFEVARALDAELDVLVVRKLGLPQQPELAVGAIASGGAVVLNPGVIRAAGLTDADIEAIAGPERLELARRERLYRGDRAPPDVRGRVVVVVDDGLATGASMQAAVAALRSLHPTKIVVAVPVAPPGVADEFLGTVDDFVCVETPRDFNSVGWWYLDFGQTPDAEVRALLATARQRRLAQPA
jgi:putative phosphoribosyl transferase